MTDDTTSRSGRGTMTRRTVTVVHTKSTTAHAKLAVQLRPVAASPAYTPPIKPSPLTVAAATLGTRFGERGGAFYLDSSPAPLARVMRETNRLLVGQGLPPVVGSPQWAWHG